MTPFIEAGACFVFYVFTCSVTLAQRDIQLGLKLSY
jgi:hypothetical protein